MKKSAVLFIYALSLASSAAFANATTDLANVITNFHVVTPGILRGGRPSMDAIEDLSLAGVKTVINLQGGDLKQLGSLANIVEPGETAENISHEHDATIRNGMNFLNFPLNSLSEVTSQEEDEIKIILKVMNDPHSQPVYVHCEHGKDRTGLIVALYRVFYQGWKPQRAHDEMLANGHSGFADHLFTGAMDRYFYKATGMPDPGGI